MLLWCWRAGKFWHSIGKLLKIRKTKISFSLSTLLSFYWSKKKEKDKNQICLLALLFLLTRILRILLKTDLELKTLVHLLLFGQSHVKCCFVAEGKKKHLWRKFRKKKSLTLGFCTGEVTSRSFQLKLVNSVFYKFCEKTILHCVGASSH